MLPLNLQQYLPRLNLQGLQSLRMFHQPLISSNRVKKRKRAEPIPRNAFPHVVEKVSHINLDRNNNDNPLSGTCYRL
jgi:hypothetical protein